MPPPSQLTTNAKNKKLQKLAEEKGLEAHEHEHGDKDKATPNRALCCHPIRRNSSLLTPF